MKLSKSIKWVATFAIVQAITLLAAGKAEAIISVKLTTDALGISSVDYNDGGTVDPDIVGKIITSPTVGQGSILTIQTNGLAGPGTVPFPLLVTVTARTHLDTVTGLPALHDYKAGAIYLTEENASTPDGKDEGLGVRAFGVTGATGLRIIDTNGRAKIEGSKEVSGGTGPSAYDSSDANGPPHVDEDAKFDFNPALSLLAKSVVVGLSKMEATDILDLHIDRVAGAPLDILGIGPTATPALFTQIGAVNDHLYSLNFSALAALSATDLIDTFSIRALEDNPADPRGTAEHFLITGFSITEGAPGSGIPEPSSLSLLVLGAATLVSRRNRKNATV